jgi:general secretion pathway protein C
VKNTSVRKPFFENYLPYLLFIFIGYCVADVVILNYRDLMLPTGAPPPRPAHVEVDNTVAKSAYNTIIARNIFSSDGVIPDPLIPAGQQRHGEDAEPVPSSLPLALKGTIVHSNPAKSIANIEVRSKNQVLPYSVGREIEGLATLTRVERAKAIFRNLNNNRLEYIEMKTEGSKISFTGSKPAAGGGGKGEIAQVAPNKYEVKRSDLLKYTSDMSSLLQQASMIPIRGPGGEIEGFKFISIQPGSVYTQLGFQNGDTIKAVNGEKIDSPAKAMELYNALKNSSNIKLTKSRDGRDEEVDYTVK